jgi:hypothetical protein
MSQYSFLTSIIISLSSILSICYLILIIIIFILFSVGDILIIIYDAHIHAILFIELSLLFIGCFCDALISIANSLLVAMIYARQSIASINGFSISTSRPNAEYSYGELIYVDLADTYCYFFRLLILILSFSFLTFHIVTM